MLYRLFDLQKVLESLTVSVEAMMPEAQRLMEQGKDYEWHKVTGMLEQIGKAEAIIRELVAVEAGEPNFGMFLDAVEAAVQDAKAEVPDA